MHSTSLSFECTAIVWEMQEGIAITNNYANIWPRGAEGVKNWPGRRNRLPHPVCKPLDSKEGGADGFVCRPARNIRPIGTVCGLQLFGARSKTCEWLSPHPLPRADAWGYFTCGRSPTNQQL